MSLNYFEKFIVKAEKETTINKNVWIYTRVSSKDQEKLVKNCKKSSAKEYGKSN
ncbi:hypothetical protein ATE84_2289 [Aquimarina sp. MAR_2010_214]|uniref:hypothetical protein n=1 Tax=Aquimarina sp. MAR_2010_214 TaxID=1250026 RepID=UPI000CC3D857|nr:hypothetical protein [Aquimarina sp. MAR_2010_214]PKV50236.1 hypothetical protein ATE84_2289 [Aquimarina sp. MAR_2010_214]